MKDAEIVELARRCRLAQRLACCDMGDEALIGAERAEKALDAALAARPAAPKKASVPSTRTRTNPRLPPEDWWPSEDTITKLTEEFPYHGVQESLATLVAEWVDYCHGAGRKYANHDAAFRNSVRRWADRHARQPASLGAARGGQHRPAGGAAGAVASLLARRAG